MDGLVFGEQVSQTKPQLFSYRSVNGVVTRYLFPLKPSRNMRISMSFTFLPSFLFSLNQNSCCFLTYLATTRLGTI